MVTLFGELLIPTRLTLRYNMGLAEYSEYMKTLDLVWLNTRYPVVMSQDGVHQSGLHGDARVTEMITQVEAGDPRAADRLLETVYDELRTLATAKLRHEKPGQTIQATVLVHEAYLRLIGDKHADWQNSAHFFAAAAEAMRRILVEQARRKAAKKHGGEMNRIELHESAIGTADEPVDLIALSDALDRLQVESPDKALLVKLRFFTGLTIQQAAENLNISPSTADRWWTFSRLQIYQWMHESD